MPDYSTCPTLGSLPYIWETVIKDVFVLQAYRESYLTFWLVTFTFNLDDLERSRLRSQVVTVKGATEARPACFSIIVAFRGNYTVYPSTESPLDPWSSASVFLPRAVAGFWEMGAHIVEGRVTSLFPLLFPFFPLVFTYFWQNRGTGPGDPPPVSATVWYRLL